MRLIQCSVLACLGLMGAVLPAQAAFHDIYLVVGVIDSGDGTNAGEATSIHCSNTSNNTVSVRVKVINKNGTTAGSVLTHTFGAKQSHTWSTHQTTLFLDGTSDSDLGTGALDIAYATIQANTNDVVLCSAEYLDASASLPAFIDQRRMIRLPRATSGGED